MNARVKARELLEKHYIKEPTDMDLSGIANAEKLMIKEEETQGHEGRIYIEGDAGIITINSKIREKGRKKFTIAHELGHFILEKEKGHYCTKDDLLTYNEHKKMERDANIFATELLMPEDWVKDYVRWKENPLATIEEASVIFEMTMSSMSIRYAECGKYPIAVIFSKDGRVKWKSINELFPYQKVEYNQKVNKLSGAYDLFEGIEIGIKPEEILIDAWFSNDKNYSRGRYLKEQNMMMKRYNAVLTFLWE